MSDRKHGRGWTTPGLARARALTATALGVAAAGLAAAGCGRETADAAGQIFQEARVERQDIVSSVGATGTIEPIRVIEVKSQASGEILEMPVELGERVERGDLLVRIDPRDVRNAHDQAEADLQVARARFEVTTRQLERTRALRDSSVVTDSELESAILGHAEAQSGLVKAQTNLELARDRLNDATVRAPIAGVIVEKNVEEGQVVTSTRDVTGGTALLRMADLTLVQVRTLVDETDIGRLEPGLSARITVEAYPDREFEGEVLKIEPQAVVEQNVTMFAVLTRIPNVQGLLRPGMNADVEIVVGRREGVLSLPNGAIKTPDEARQLASALGLDPGLLESRVQLAGDPGGARGRSVRGGEGDGAGGGSGAMSGDAESNGPASDGSGASSDDEDDLPSPERLRSMSPEERRSFFESLPADQRRRLFQAMRERREVEEAAQRANPARPRPAFVFRYDDEDRLTLEPVTIGLSSWDATEVVAGLDEGERVVQVPLSLVQQQELLERFRARSGVPGVSRN